MASIPKAQRQWTLRTQSADGLELVDAPVPGIGDGDVLVKIKAASLNYRDLLILHNNYPSPIQPSLVPLSDGAGQVVAVGSRVTRFAVGDRVIPSFIQTHYSGRVTPAMLATSLGGQAHGVAHEYAAFSEHALVRIPESLGYAEAATLPCAALTAWNALFGLEGRRAGPGDWVLTQGTGGVSVFALQFAKLVGARVVATTSSPAKAARLRDLGADVVINYRDTPEWSVPARAATGGAGFEHIIEVGGPGTLAESYKAIAYEGVISIIGRVGGTDAKSTPSMHAAMANASVVRGIKIGSRAQLEDLARAVDANGLRPVLDERRFGFGELREAYKYLEGQGHFGKVVVEFE